MELYCSNPLGNRAIPTVLVGYQVAEFGDDRRVVRVWILGVRRIIDHGLARMGPRPRPSLSLQGTLVGKCLPDFSVCRVRETSIKIYHFGQK